VVRSGSEDDDKDCCYNFDKAWVSQNEINSDNGPPLASLEDVPDTVSKSMFRLWIG
jgi:hypothetical protein